MKKMIQLRVYGGPVKRGSRELLKNKAKKDDRKDGVRSESSL